MWKILLVDDEAVIVKGLKRLIDWAALQTEIVGEATDGKMAVSMMEELRPDLVISDIRMPEMSGLEVMDKFRDNEYNPKFIFISGYEEFEYAHKALAGGAVDYLLKPVSADALVNAVRKALNLMEESSTAAFFREPSEQMQEFFEHFTANREFSGSKLYQRFMAMVEDYENPAFVGLCFGLTPDAAARLEDLPYERQLLQRFMIFNTVRSELELCSHGCFLRKDNFRCHLMGIFEPEEPVKPLLRVIMDEVESKTGYRLRVGIGRAYQKLTKLADTYEEAMLAFDLYYFEEQQLISWDDEPYQITNSIDSFEEAVKAMYHSIISKSERIEEDIDKVLDIIADLHYGNQGIALNRAMVFTDSIIKMLISNNILSETFAQQQDTLQHKLEECQTFSRLRQTIHDYYKVFLPNVYQTVRSNSANEIYRVQQYIEEHYSEALSLKVLAKVACVSPNYFSAYFKAETGQNYKAYLTQVRLEHALNLVITTDLKTYEISECVGYNNVRRFVDAFRAAYQMSPMDYRKMYKQ